MHVFHNVLLVVRVVGLLFALEMAILGVFLALDRPSPSNFDFLYTKLDIDVQLFKSF